MAFNVKFKLPKLPSYLKSVKYSLIAVNSLFLVTGLLLLITGIAVLSSYSYYDEMITNRFFNIPGFTVATGVVILLVSVLGYYGAMSQSFYTMVAYVVLLLVVLVFEIAIVIAAFALRNDSPSIIRTPMLASLQLYNRLDVAQVWDNLQRAYECCGVAGRFDYISSQVPVSCCHMDYGTISPFECGTANAYQIGCSTALGEYLAGKANALAIVALTAMGIQVLVASAAGWLAWRSKSEEVELEQ